MIFDNKQIMKKAFFLRTGIILMVLLMGLPVQMDLYAEENAKTAQADSAGLKKGRALKKGDCIGITAPAYYIEDDDFNQTILFLRMMGFRVKITKSCASRDRYFAGSDRQRAKELNDLFEDDSVDAIMCLRGGYGCARILDYLDYDMIAEHPKLLIGYSDITALHIALMEKCGIVSASGPMISSFNDIYSQYVQELFLGIDTEKLTGMGKTGGGGMDQTVKTGTKPETESEKPHPGIEHAEDTLIRNGIIDLNEVPFEETTMAYTVSQFTDGITSNKPIGEIELPEDGKLESLVTGTAQGVIIGGNLTVIASLVGTEYELQGDHALLFFEEVGEKAYRIDRMLQQLYQNGLFDRVDGILIGEMIDNQDQDDCTVEEVLEEYARLAGKPCISGIPSGHGDNNMFLPFGVTAKMTAEEDGTAKLEILEPALR